MEPHVLNDGDRAALQALVPLAGALGVGTIFALFFGGRRKSGVAVFELFAIVAVLTAAGSTAYFSVSLLHQNEPISNADLTQTATPLLVAAFLLVFVSVFARLPGSATRVFSLVPLALTAIVVSALLAGTSWSAGPENASLLALIILAVGVALGCGAWAIEWLDVNWDRRLEHRRLTRLYAAGYLPDERRLGVGLPAAAEGGAPETIPCWVRKGRTHLDVPAWLLLRRETSASWRALATGAARPPVGPKILFRVRVGFRIPLIRGHAIARIFLLEPSRSGKPRVEELRSNEDGVFDVTELGLI